MLTKAIPAFLADENGATVVEYGLLLLLISVALLGTYAAIGNSLGNMLGVPADTIKNATDGLN